MNSMIRKESQLSIALIQTKDKLYHNINAFLFLMILHLIGYLISSSSGMGYLTGGDYFDMSYRNFSVAPLYVMTIFWMILQGFSFGEEKSRQYYMVSNNFTAYFSDIAVLEIYALTAGLLTLFSGFLIQVFGSLFVGNFMLHSLYASIGISNYLTLWFTGTLYFLIFGTVGYLVGILRSRYRSRFFLGLLLTAVVWILGSILVSYSIQGPVSLDISTVFRFYLNESRFFIWLAKVLLTIAALYGLSYLAVKNMEVNR